jgi:hypothetical protein
MEKQSRGNKRLKKIKTVYNVYSRTVREAERHRTRLKKLIDTFPRDEHPLYEEKLQGYINRMHDKSI